MMKLYALDGKVFDAVLVGADDDGCVNADSLQEIVVTIAEQLAAQTQEVGE